MARRLDEADEGKPLRGRKSTDRRAYLRFCEAVSEAGLSPILKADLNADRFSFHRDEAALANAERGFRVLKSDIEIAPVHHRLPERIHAHALICFLALVIHRIMRQKLKAAGHPFSPRGALALLRQIQQHRTQLMANPSRVSDIFNPSRSSCSKHSNSCCPTPIASCSGIFAPSASMQSTTYSSSYGTWLFRTPAK